MKVSWKAAIAVVLGVAWFVMLQALGDNPPISITPLQSTNAVWGILSQGPTLGGSVMLTNGATLTVSNNTYVTGTLTTGPISATNNATLTVSGAAYTPGGLTGSSVSVTNNGTLSVSGATTATGTLYTPGGQTGSSVSITNNGTLSVSGATTATGTLYSPGGQTGSSVSITNNGTLSVSGATTTTGTHYAPGGITGSSVGITNNGTLTVNGATYAQAGVTEASLSVTNGANQTASISSAGAGTFAGGIATSNTSYLAAAYLTNATAETGFTNAAGYVSQKSLNTTVSVATNMTANGMSYWTNYTGADGTLYIAPTVSMTITNVVLGSTVLCGQTNLTCIETINLRQSEWMGLGRVSGTPVMIWQWH